MINKIYAKTKNYIKNNYKDLIGIILLILLFTIELPFVIYKSGGVIDLSKRIEVDSGYEYEGKIEMTYVSMIKGKIPFVLLSYVIPGWDLEKSSDITYEGDSVSTTIKKDKIQCDGAIDNAIIAAYNLTNNKVNITKYHNHIIFIADEANTTLKDFDEIISIDGQEVHSLTEMQGLINTYKENDIVNIKVLRDKKTIDTTAKIYKFEDKLKIGISIATTYDLDTDPVINIKSKQSESGPSGGLMTAIGIYNSLTKDDITKGKTIAGTGTIDADGRVGEIGGIKYKILGAIKKDVDIFICPKENYEEAKKVLDSKNANMKLIYADTLEDAINKLNEM